MQNNSLLFSNYKLIEGLEDNTPATTLNRYVQYSIDMSNNINNLKTQMTQGINNDILDADGNLKSQGRLVDVAQQDTQLMLIQQNTLYLIGTITIATLLITTILLSK
jgi:hypothetical protein